MTQIEIRRAIDLNNQLINTLLTPNQFTLNNEVARLLQENKNYQSQCQHHFVDGYCEFCDMEESNG